MSISIYSIRTRFIFSLFSNLLRGGTSFFTNILIARYLLPGNYGVLAFLLTSFQALMQLFDQGISSAFYTFISKKAPKVETYYVYFIWVVIQLVLVVLFISALLPDSLLNTLWKHSSRGLVLWAFIAIFSQQVIWWSVAQLGEAKRKTLITQSANVLVAILYLSVIYVAQQFSKLTPTLVLKSMTFIYLSASFLMFFIFVNYRAISKIFLFNYRQFKLCFADYYIYCKPLILMAIVAFFYTFLTNWMLNHFGGSVQQGYYQISYRFTSIALLVTTSILRVFWKELAMLDEAGDSYKMEFLFYKVIKIVFFSGAVIAGFIIPWSKEIILLFLGKAYLSGWVILSVMLFYPVHQSMGQVLGATYAAISKTRAYSLVSMPSMLVAIVSTYFLLAPSTSFIPGLSLGGVGMSINMVVIQLFSVFLSFYVICKLKKWAFKWKFQFIVFGTTLLLGYIAKALVVNIIFRGNGSMTLEISIIHIALAFFLYMSMTFCFLLFKTELFLGIERKALLAMIPFEKLIR